MIRRDDVWAHAQRRRFMRPDAHRYVRHDAWRFMAPGAPRLLGKEAVGYFWPEAKRAEPPQPDSRENVAALIAERDELLHMRSELAVIKAEFKWQALRRNFKANFNPNQLRVPAGNSEGGQWAAEEGEEAERTSDLSDLGTSDATDFSSQRRRGDGHHRVHRALYEKLPLPAETRKVFEDAKTGPLYDSRSNKYDSAHRRYNDAVEELFEGFVKEHNIQIEQMSPGQARAFVDQVLTSNDPRIRNFNMLIQMREIMRRVFRGPLRGE